MSFENMLAANVAMAPPAAEGRWSRLGRRILSAAVLAPPALAAVYVGTPYFDGLVALAVVILLWEVARTSGIARGETRTLWGWGALLYVVGAGLAALWLRSAPAIGRDMIFVAGDRVLTDPLAVPFSMGCNLLCIYSKRYIDHPPERKAAKQAHNQKTMERMRALLSAGGCCLYAAPSGGRDRVNAQGLIEVAPFDPQSVEMYHLMARRAHRPSHFYPMALATYAFLPPPDTVQVELGEARRIRRTGIHMAVGAEIDMEHFPGAPSDKRERRLARADYFWQAVRHEYSGIVGS